MNDSLRTRGSSGAHGVLATIGNTPMVRLDRLPAPGAAEVWVKLEAANPTGSYKDRMARSVIERAERDGRLESGRLVVEYTGGSTGSSLALVCAVTGHPLRLVTSDAFSAEKLRTMRALGAELEIIPSPGGIHPGLIPAMRDRAAQVVAETGGFDADQFHNPDVALGYEALGDEVVAALPAADVFCAFVGTAGCFLGATAAMRRAWPGLQRVVVEPAESAVISGSPPGTHRIEGGGVGFIPPKLTGDRFDAVETVTSDQAWAVAREAARLEGLWGGPSGGANLAVALRLAERLGRGHRVVTVQPDSGLKYLSGGLYS